jgi:hypothetical protein
VYAYGGYAVHDPDSFAPEYAWQVNALRKLAEGGGRLMDSLARDSNF